MLQFDDNFDAIIAQIETAAQKATDATCDELRDEARANPPSPEHPGPYATGATMDGLYIATPHGSDYPERVAQAKTRREHLDKYILPEEHVAPVAGEYTALLVAVLLYDIWLHSGTGRQRAQPFLLRAFLSKAKSLETNLRHELNKI